MGYPPRDSVSALLEQQTPLQQSGDAFLHKFQRFGHRVARGLVESVNFLEPDISGRERLARGVTAASFFVPFGVTAKLAGAGAKLGARVLATGAQEAAIGGTIAAIRGEPIAPHAAISGGVGGVLEAVLTRGRLSRARRAHRAANEAFDVTPQQFTSLRETPLRSAEYAIISPQRAGVDAAVNAERTAAFVEELQRRGYDPIRIEGFSPLREGENVANRVKEDSFIVPGMSDQEALELAIRYNQDAVITRKGLFNIRDGTIRELDTWGLKFNGAVSESDDYFSALRLADDEPATLFSMRFSEEATPLRAGPLTQPLAAKYIHPDNPDIYLSISRNTRNVQSGVMEKIDATGKPIHDLSPGGKPLAGNEIPGWRVAFQNTPEDVAAGRNPIMEEATEVGEVGPWKLTQWLTRADGTPQPVGHSQFRSYEEAVAYARDRGYKLDEVFRPSAANPDPVLNTAGAIRNMIQPDPTFLQRATSRMRNAPWMQKLHMGYQGLMDKWHGFDLLDMAATGKSWRKLHTVPVQQSVRAAAQLMGGFASVAEHNLKNGLVSITTGRTLKPGLYELVQRNLTEEEFQPFIEYGFARRWLAVERTGKKLPTKPDGTRFTTEELQELIDTAPQHFAKTFDRIVDWRNTLLREYLGKTGVLSRKAVRAILTSEDYVPLRRALDEIVERVNIESPANFFGVFSPVKELRVMGDQFQNWFHVLEKETVLFSQLAHQQRTLNRVVNALHNVDPASLGRFAKRVRKPKLKLSKLKREMIAQVRQSDPALADAVQHLDEEVLSLLAPNIMLSGRPVVGALVRGKRQHWEITDPNLWESIKSMGPVELNWFERLVANPASRGAASLFRAGTVLSLEFMGRNPIRDIVWAAVTAASNPTNFFRGIASALKGDEWFKRWMAAGGPRAALVSMDRKVLREQFANAIHQRGNVLTGVVRHPIDALRAFSELMETGTRLGHFRKQYTDYLGRGMDAHSASLQAALDSRNVSVDFAVHGSKVAALRLSSAFWNPMLQSWREMATKGARDLKGVGIRGFIGITLPSMFFYLANTRGDPETAEEYRQLPQWEKMLFWHMKAGDTWLRVPKPFELGIVFGTLPEQMFAAIDAEQPEILDEAFATTAQDIAKNFVPVPTLLRPFAERMANYDFFRERPIISRGDQELEPKFRETAGTSEVAKQMVRMLRLDQLGIDPITVDHFMRSYTGGLGMMGTDIADIAYRASVDAPAPPGTRKVGPIDVPTRAKDMPLARGFVSRFPENNEAMEEFYRFADSVRKASRTASTLERELRMDDLQDFLQQRAAVLGMSSDVNAVMEELTALRHQRVQIHNDPSMDGATKQELIDQIIETEYRLAMAAAEMEELAEESQLAIDEQF